MFSVLNCVHFPSFPHNNPNHAWFRAQVFNALHVQRGGEARKAIPPARCGVDTFQLAKACARELRQILEELRQKRDGHARQRRRRRPRPGQGRLGGSRACVQSAGK